MKEAMQAAGIEPPQGELEATGKITRYSSSQEKSKKNWYILFADGDFQAGSFGRWQGNDNGAVQWCSRNTFTITTADKEKWVKLQAEFKRKSEADRKTLTEECIKWCQKAWDEGTEPDENHPYLVKKQIKAYGIKQRKDMLMIPIRSLVGGLFQGMQLIQPDGSKTFKTGSTMKAGLHLVGKPIDNTLIITEGYATAVSIHEATGHAVLVAFNAGNLKDVAEAARTKQPAWKLIIAADNDRWAKIKNAEGEVIEYRAIPCEVDGKKRVNTGMKEAARAAKATGARVISPVFECLDTHPTDFNDLACLEGLDTVRLILFPPPMDDYQPYPMEELEADPRDDDEPRKETTPNVFNDAPFRLLGYDRNIYYYLPDGAAQVTSMTPTQHTEANICTIAHPNYYEGKSQFSQGAKIDYSAIRNALVHQQHKVGIFEPDNIRGLGAWEDAGRSVLHLGKELRVDCKTISLSQFRSKYIYERAASIAGDKVEALSNAEASKLITMCNMLSWEKPINSYLLAGWCVAAIICGALKWRPHIWLTGPSASGKSWCIHSIIKHITGHHCLGMLGSTTEPGLRRAIGNDAFSVFFDEFESENKESSARIQSILEYARPASCNIDAKIYKAKAGGQGVDSFQPRSCIGLASINVAITQKADENRISVISLVNGTQEHFKNNIVPYWTEHISPPEFAAGIRTRAIELIPIINKNAEIFQRAATPKLGSRRGGDQYGALLACAYSLTSKEIATDEKAQEFVNRHDWEAHILATDGDDENRCLDVILETLIRVEPTKEMSIAEMINTVAKKACTPAGEEKNYELRAQLLRYGIRVDDEYFQISNRHSGIKKILASTAWASGWPRILERVKGAKKTGKAVRFAETVSAAVSIPLSYVVEQSAEDLPFLN